jgi:hypothetical protein
LRDHRRVEIVSVRRENSEYLANAHLLVSILQDVKAMAAAGDPAIDE